jgi:hypothetical protein
MAKIVPLPFIAAMGPKERQLLLVFHALSYHPVLQGPSHANNGANDDSIVGTRNDIVHERLVQLYGINGKSS